MNGALLFFVNSILFGTGLAMDAFSVSMANGLGEPGMSGKKEMLISGTFCFFQTAMPLAGWLCVHTAAAAFSSFQELVPWIAFILLLYIGGRMLLEGIRGQNGETGRAGTGFRELMIQGVATSLDALSVGFTISDMGFAKALTESLIIGAVTFVISFAGIKIGKRFGTKLQGKASVLGGLILVGIGIEIIISHVAA